jgi:hypothetical protein
MAFEKLIERIRKIKADIINNREADALRIGFDMTALIKFRIQTRGENADGAQFVPYTPLSKSLRAAKGYQIGYVDFTQTGRLWANIAPRIESSSVFSATVVIEGSEQRSKDLVQKFAPKRGNILKASPSEIELARKANRSRIEKYLRF